jgi:hypothetical protein
MTSGMLYLTRNSTENPAALLQVDFGHEKHLRRVKLTGISMIAAKGGKKYLCTDQEQANGSSVYKVSHSGLCNAIGRNFAPGLFS